MKGKFKFLPIFVVIVLLVLSTGVQATSSDAKAGITRSPVIKKVLTQAEQDATLAFWTNEAILSAQPMVMPIDYGPAVANPNATAMKAAGSPGFTPSGAAAPDADSIAEALFPDDWAVVDQVTPLAGEPTGTSQVYTSYIVNQWYQAQKVYPHKWVGRLSFSTSGGTSYCSATALGGDTIVTAAHCLYDTTNNVWYWNWAFIPAFRDIYKPYGVFPATTCWILTAWANLSGSYSITGWAPYDVGVCEMGTNFGGYTLNYKVGWAGHSWDWGYDRHYFNMGYPWQDYNLNTLVDAGKYLRTCVAESFYQAPEVRGMGCNWGPGISGGPWMTAYAPPLVSGYVDGVNSGLYIGTQNMYGGRFNSNNIVPLCTSAGC